MEAGGVRVEFFSGRRSKLSIAQIQNGGGGESLAGAQAQEGGDLQFHLNKSPKNSSLKSQLQKSSASAIGNSKFQARNPKQIQKNPDEREFKTKLAASDLEFLT